MREQSASDRREFYRIEFPAAERPLLVLDRGEFVVRDCSERGVRFDPGTDGTEGVIAPGTPVRGVVRFRRGDEAPVEGEVVRVDEGGVALHLTRSGIPFAIILQEQRRLYTLQGD